MFALFDIAEVIHELDESRTGLAIFAVVIAIGHLAAAVLAAGAGRHLAGRAAVGPSPA